MKYIFIFILLQDTQIEYRKKKLMYKRNDPESIAKRPIFHFYMH